MLLRQALHRRVEQVETAASDASFLASARDVLREPGSMLLLSGGDHPCAEHSILASEPLLVFTAHQRALSIHTSEGQRAWEGDPLEALDQLVASIEVGGDEGSGPMSGGLVGYLAYELKNQIERLPQTADDDLGLPDVRMVLHRRVLIHHRRSGVVESIVLDGSGLDVVEVPRAPSTPEADTAGLSSSFDREAYLDAVDAVRRHISAGDVYQVSLSQRFEAPTTGEPLDLLAQLHASNPAPYFAYLDGGDHVVLSTSMERFLWRRGDEVETRPIKGTRPRGGTPEEDEALQKDLASHPKDDAEISMIVDLLRNDLGRVCAPHTIRVAEHKRLESYANVHHLVSVVRGRLAPGTTAGELLRATFPSGSVTGCPKIRAMEVIDSLEPCVRGVYTGAIGYLGLGGELDLSVAIRTAILGRGVCAFSMGGGIVHDSRAPQEYQETLDKGRSFFELLGTISPDPGR